MDISSNIVVEQCLDTCLCQENGRSSWSIDGGNRLAEFIAALAAFIGLSPAAYQL